MSGQENTTLQGLATHFCNEFPHDDPNAGIIVDLFHQPQFADVLAASNTSEGFVMQTRASKEMMTHKHAMNLCNVVEANPSSYIKLRSMNLTQKLMDAMPPAVRTSIERMASQLLSSLSTSSEAVPPQPHQPQNDADGASDVAVDSLAAAAASDGLEGLKCLVESLSPPIESADDAPPASSSSAPPADSAGQMISRIMQSGMFQEMSDMMKAEVDDNQTTTEQVAFLEEKVSLLWDRVTRLENRFKRGKKPHPKA
jgi:hypothetical protein